MLHFGILLQHISLVFFSISGLILLLLFSPQNCMEQSVPVRVVRGHKCQNSYVGKVYTYDGLYKVAMSFMLEKKYFLNCSCSYAKS